VRERERKKEKEREREREREREEETKLLVGWSIAVMFGRWPSFLGHSGQ
jgi:hypothetical protein